MYALPEVFEAAVSFDVRGGINKIKNDLRIIADKYDFAKYFGVQIVHGHFPVTDGEQLVAFGPVSLTVTTEGITPQAQQFIKPTSWRFDSIHEKITAYEFTYDPENRLLDTPQDFLTEMFSLMKRLGLTEILGIVQFISDDPLLYLEESRGRAKISLPQKVFSQHEGYLEVVWSLAPKNVGQCKTKCSFRGPLRPHQPIHVFS